mgnify:CR=1 FL=1
MRNGVPPRWDAVLLYSVLIHFTPMAYCQSQDHQLFILNEAEQTVISNAYLHCPLRLAVRPLPWARWVSAVHEVFLSIHAFSIRWVIAV